MAFMGIFLMFAAAVLIIVGTATFIAAVLYIVAAVVSYKAKKKGKKRSAAAIVLRVIGTVFMIPLALVFYVIISSAVQTKIEHTNNIGYAVSRYDFNETEKLLKKGYSPECSLGSKELAADGDMTLLTAVIYDRSDDFASHTDEERARMIRLLIEYGADVNAVTYHHDRDDSRHKYTEEKDFYLSDDMCGYTPLLYAVHIGDFETVKLLAENGADIKVRDHCGFDAVSTIADDLDDEKGAEMLRWFIDSGLNAGNITNFGQGAGFLAFRNGNPLNQFPADNDEIQRIIEEAGGGYGVLR